MYGSLYFEEFLIKEGLRQGVVSPTLFAVGVNHRIKEIKSNSKEVKCGNLAVEIMEWAFVGDLVNFERNEKGLQYNLQI